MDSDLVQLHEPIALRHTLLDENRVEVLHIRQTDKFIDRGVIAYVPLEIGIGFAPLLCRNSEHRHIQHIGFVGVDDVCLCRSDLRRDKVLLYGICMHAVVYFRQLTFSRPTQQPLFLRLQPLKFLDDVEFKFNRNPACELQCNVFMRIRSAITS